MDFRFGGRPFLRSSACMANLMSCRSAVNRVPGIPAAARSKRLHRSGSTGMCPLTGLPAVRTSPLPWNSFDILPRMRVVSVAALAGIAELRPGATPCRTGEELKPGSGTARVHGRSVGAPQRTINQSNFATENRRPKACGSTVSASPTMGISCAARLLLRHRRGPLS